jgi:hypothetical protein
MSRLAVLPVISEIVSAAKTNKQGKKNREIRLCYPDRNSPMSKLRLDFGRTTR